MSYLQDAKTLITLYKTTKELKELFDRVISSNTITVDNKVRLFLDIRGMFINLHDRPGNLLLVNYYKAGNNIYSNIIVNTINSWFSYFKGKNIDCEIIGFAETGSSEYHEELLENEYKIARKKQRNKIPESERVIGKKYINEQLKNLQMTFNVIGSQAIVVTSDSLEIDCTTQFIKTLNNDPKYINFIFTKDKDMCQTLDDNTYIVRKKIRGKYELIDKHSGSMMLKLTKSIDHRLYSLALSLIGDTADSIHGLKGAGPVLVSNFLESNGKAILNSEGDTILEQMYNHLENNTLDSYGVKVKKILEKDDLKTKFDISYKCVDFDNIIECNIEELENSIGKYYNKIIHGKTDDPDTMSGKKSWMTKRFMVKHDCTNELEYAYILNNIK